MADQLAEGGGETLTYGDTFDPAFEDGLVTTEEHENTRAEEDVEEDAEAEAISYLVPRLAAYAEDSSPSSFSSSAAPSRPQTPADRADSEEIENGLQNNEEEARRASAKPSSGRGSDERSAAHVTGGEGTAEASQLAPTLGATPSTWAAEKGEEEGEEGEEERAFQSTAVHRNTLQDGRDTSEDVTDADRGGETAVDAHEEAPEDATDGEEGDTEDDEEENDVNEEERGDRPHSHHAHAHHGSSHAYNASSTSSSYATAFAHSRVKELLKFEGSSSIISKDAAAAACEAVALLTRDLVATAAAEATRKNRKTLTYDDVARVAQLLDRFSFLADVVPPAPASSSGAALNVSKSIVVGSHVQSSTSAAAGSVGHSHSSSSGTARKKSSLEASARGKSAQGRGRPATTTFGSVGGAGGGSAGAVGRSKTANARVAQGVASTQGVHPSPGGMRQATLRF